MKRYLLVTYLTALLILISAAINHLADSQHITLLLLPKCCQICPLI